MQNNKSNDITELIKALNKFQSKVVRVERTTTNPFFKAKYADLSSIMLESQPILTECELAISQFPSIVDGLPALRTILMHTSGQFIEDVIPLPVSKITTVTNKEKTTKSDPKVITSEGFEPQEFGRAVTYMRRYGYAAVLQIVIDEDNDGNPLQKPERPPADPSNPETIKKIKEIWVDGGGTEDKLTDWVKKNNDGKLLENLTGSRQNALLQVLENKKTEKAAKTEPAAEEPQTEVGQPAKEPVKTEQ